MSKLAEAREVIIDVLDNCYTQNSLFTADAILAALNAAGLKIIAREPTKEMENIGDIMIDIEGQSTATWHAMWDAALPSSSDEVVGHG